jgi:tetratricopeptide (TPR) repeat protein
MVRWIALLALSAIALHAQQTPKRKVNLINAHTPGAISVPVAEGWHIDFTNVYDDGTRPVLQLSNEQTGITASVSLFDNYYKKPDPAGCRKDATDGVLAHQAAAITGRKDFSGKATDGTPLAYTSWVIHGNPATVLQRNFFAFASDAQTCYEIHVSKILAGKPVDAELEHALRLFHIRLDYKPDAADEMVMASLLNGSTPALAATYYREALNRTPAGPQSLTARRVLTDELVMSLGMGGDLKDSRAIAQQAIELDPDYPLNYYNLACADAEAGNATEARIHLEQAFARKQNVIQGESMPDPTKDDSLLKLKSHAEFWAYVQTLR